MAAAEARVTWQRIANCCLVRDDARRDPKLSCCPSSTPQSDSGTENTASVQDYHIPNVMPDLSPETKWWLQQQPNSGCLKYFICEQLRFLEDEVDEKVMEATAPTSKLDGESLPIDSIDFVHTKGDCYPESPCMVSTDFMKHGSGTRVKEMKTTISYSQKPVKRKTDMDFLYKEEALLDLKSVDRLTSRRTEKTSLDFESPWSGSIKSEPWWRMADKYELATLVAQKSLKHIENCDLPKPTQTVPFTKDPFSSAENSDTGGRFQSSVGRKLNEGICNANEYSHNPTTGSSDKYLHDSDKFYSHTGGHVKNEPPESNQTSENDTSRVQLLEALRHSQTRARQAEMATQKAYEEKEHIVKLLFKQASHLFAYKQWLQMLQLENFCLQLKIRDHPISTHIAVPPWMPSKMKLCNKEKKTRRKKHKCMICKSTLAFAVGLGLAGVGLFFGLTLAWLFPT